MKKNGFTLVELLSVLVLIGLLMGIGVPGVMRIRSNMQKRSLNTKIKQVEQAATLYGQDNKTTINNPVGDNCSSIVIDATSCVSISIMTLIDMDYLDGDMYKNDVFKNPVNGSNLVDSNECSDCYVVIYKNNNRIYATLNNKTCSSCID